MAANIYFMEQPEQPELVLTHPAYFDRVRRLVHPGAAMLWYYRGWVMVWPDDHAIELDDDGNIITQPWVDQIVLREDRGELLADDGDVMFPDGHTVYAEPKEAFEEWAVAKACFNLSNKWIVRPDNVEARFDKPWRANVHFMDYTGPLAVSCVGNCKFEDINLDRYFRGAWRATDIDPRAITIDMESAQQIHMGRKNEEGRVIDPLSIRAYRDRALVELDVPFMRALESRDTVEQGRIAVLKRTLMDLPATFDLTRYDTPEDLKSAWPPELL